MGIFLFLGDFSIQNSQSLRRSGRQGPSGGESAVCAVLKLQKRAPAACSVGMSHSAVIRGRAESGCPWGPMSPLSAFCSVLKPNTDKSVVALWTLLEQMEPDWKWQFLCPCGLLKPPSPRSEEVGRNYELYWQWCRGKDESQAEFRDPLEQCDLGTVMVLVGLLSCVP